MKKFVLLAHGEIEHTPQFQQAHQAWWGAMAGHVIDSGNPLVNGRDVRRDGNVSDVSAGASPALGYTIIEAATIEDAVALLDGCPMDMWLYEAVPM